MNRHSKFRRLITPTAFRKSPQHWSLPPPSPPPKNSLKISLQQNNACDCVHLRALVGCKRKCLTYRTALFWVITQRVVLISYRRFGTTYRSHLQGSFESWRWDRFIKSRYRSRLTDEHLKYCLLLCLRNYEPLFIKLSKDMQCTASTF